MKTARVHVSPSSMYLITRTVSIRHTRVALLYVVSNLCMYLVVVVSVL